jgi:antitoxin (DNA-binding transcriptional repressor) of toxin-antitoxin stability system
MSQIMSVQDAATRLHELLRSLGNDGKIVLTDDGKPIARIIPARESNQRHPGSCKGMLIVHEDDDEHLADFKEYMP